MGLIYLDACLLIYLVEQHALWGRRVDQAIADIPESNFGISPLVKLECLVGPIERGDPVLRLAYEAAFDRLAMVEMPDPVYLQAAELRARFDLRTPDALHLSCAQYHRCEALWTNDDRLARASHGLARNVFASGQ
jgi:uncharacterized protein